MYDNCGYTVGSEPARCCGNRRPECPPAVGNVIIDNAELGLTIHTV